MGSAAASHKGASRHLTTDDFDALMQHCALLGDAPHIAVAVSGGPDSIALTFLLNEWVKQRGGTLHALTVDHQLRKESAQEAAQVAAWCAEKNILHTTLKWEKETAHTSVPHEVSRTARYQLLYDACRQHGICHLFLGHHADDQAETVLMRFLKGSGVDGLAGMPSTRMQDGITLIRPLLPVQKQMLIATCTAHKWPFVRDPSNDSEHYLRGRLRALAEPLAAEGVTTASLYDMARNAGMARAVLETKANEWLKTHAILNPLGYIHLDMQAWKKLDDEQQRRVLVRALLCMSGEDYAPKATSLEYLVHALLTKETPHQTLCGCHIMVQFGMIKIYREQIALPKAARFENNMLWDNRFRIITTSSPIDKNLSIAPLGELGRDVLEKMGHKQVADCPALHRATLPALYVDNQLHSVPKFVTEPHTDDDAQALVKAIFSPKRMLYVDGFHTCPALLV